MGTHDPVDFSDFVSANWSRMYRLAVMAAGSPELGEDCLQTALVKACDRWSRTQAVEDPWPRGARPPRRSVVSSRP
jgi:DNA-directed RNA polymerase specialized sigma24 family protein